MGNLVIDNELGNGRIRNCAAFPELVNVVAAAPTATTNIDVLLQSLQYRTINATANFVANIRGDASNSFNSVSVDGEAYSVVLMVTNGATPYYLTGLQVDGVVQNIKWQGGTAPSAGNANSIDCYTFTVIKTATNTYTVLGAATKYA